MTTTETRPLPRNRKVGPTVRAEARKLYLASVAAGEPISGAELGRRFGCSDRWGRELVRDARAELDTGSDSDEGPSPEERADREGGSNGHLPTTPIGSNGHLPEGAGSKNGTDHRGGSNDGSPAQPIPMSGRAAQIETVLALPKSEELPTTDGHPAPDDRLPPVHENGAVVGGSARARRVIRWITTVTVIGVALAAARSSYDHQRVLIEMAGQHKAAWYLPLSVDGMMVIASMNMLLRRWDGEPAGWLTWCAMLLGGTGSLAANIAAAQPTLLGRFVAAWSPICLLVSYELLLQQLPSRKGARR